MATSDGLKCIFFGQEPRTLLSANVKRTPSSDFTTVKSKRDLYSHRTNSMLGRSVTPLAQNIVKERVEDDVYWRTREVDGRGLQLDLCRCLVTNISRNCTHLYSNVSLFT